MKTSHVLLPALAAALLAACHRTPVEQPARNQPSAAAEPVVKDGKITFAPHSPQLAALGVEPAQPCVGTTVQLNGRLLWDDDVTVRIFTPFAGRVVKITADAGQAVQKDETLATIVSPDFGQAQADARRAASALALAARNVTRIRELHEHGAAPQKDLHAAEADLEQARAEQQRASARLAFFAGSQTAIDQTFPLRSPVAGVVVEKNLNTGQEVRPDMMLANLPQLAAPHFVITDPTRLWIWIDATEQELPNLKAGQTFTLRSRTFPGQTFTGRVHLVSDSLDPTTRTVKVRGSVDNAQRLLKAEMFVTVELASDKIQAGQDVPTKAVFLKGDKHFLFVEDAPGQFSRREIKMALEHDGKIVVRDGLESGQRVVTEGCLLLEAMLESLAKL